MFAKTIKFIKGVGDWLYTIEENNTEANIVILAMVISSSVLAVLIFAYMYLCLWF